MRQNAIIERPSPRADSVFTETRHQLSCALKSARLRSRWPPLLMDRETNSPIAISWPPMCKSFGAKAASDAIMPQKAYAPSAGGKARKDGSLPVSLSCASFSPSAQPHGWRSSWFSSPPSPSQCRILRNEGTPKPKIPACRGLVTRNGVCFSG